MTKNDLRADVRAAMATMTRTEQNTASEAIIDRLAAHPSVKSATAIAAFCAINGEPDLSELLIAKQQEGIPLFLPRWCQKTKEYKMASASDTKSKGPHGALEPDATAAVPAQDQLDSAVWLIPGLAFDATGNRLGRGGGYYDRLLANTLATFIGVAFHNQLRENLPAELHDIRVHHIVTDSVSMRCTPLKKELDTWNILLDSSDSASASSAASSFRKPQRPMS